MLRLEELKAEIARISRINKAEETVAKSKLVLWKLHSNLYVKSQSKIFFK
jgi:hypothetical protein